MEVSEVRKILLDIKTYDPTKKGMVYADYQRAETLLERIPEEGVLTEGDVTAINNILRSRWDSYVHGPNDYTINQSGHNEYWIELAEKMATAKLVKRTSKELLDSPVEEKRYKNFLEILMPTLKEQHFEPCTLDPFDDIDISELIVSQDKRYLLSVKTALSTAEQLGVIYCYPYEGAPRFFSEEEKIRIKNYKQKIVTLYQPATDLKIEQNIIPTSDEPITKETVLALKALAEGSASKFGLGHEVIAGTDESRAADKAYDVFSEYQAKLTEKEKKALSGQMIESSLTTWRTFKEEYDETVFGERLLCTTHVALAWAKLVMQYMPDVVFLNEAIERQKKAQGWLLTNYPLTLSNRVPYKGYEKEKEDELYYKRACLSLLVFVMSNQFSVATFFGGESLTFGSQKNQGVPTSAFKMFKVIQSALNNVKEDQENELPIYKRAYFDILEYVVKPAIEEPSPTRYPGTQDWLDSLADESFWRQTDIKLDQETLGAKILFFLSQYQSDKLKHVGKLIDSITVLASKEKSFNSATLELAMIANQLKTKFNVEDAQVLDSYLSGKRDPFSEEHVGRYLKERVVLRYLYYLSYKETSRSSMLNPGGIFKSVSASNEHLFSVLTALLRTVQQEMSPSASIKSIIDAVIKQSNERTIRISPLGTEKAQHYFDKFDDSYLNEIDLTLSDFVYDEEHDASNMDLFSSSISM